MVTYEQGPTQASHDWMLCLEQFHAQDCKDEHCMVITVADYESCGLLNW